MLQASMSTQWNTRSLSDRVGDVIINERLGAETVVILMRGKNPFGDRIYSYLKLTLGDLKRMQTAVAQGAPFNPSDFGSVVAAGRGEPTPEIRAEIESLYRVVDGASGAEQKAAAAPTQKKAWDEY
jgi:hypothetical protein